MILQQSDTNKSVSELRKSGKLEEALVLAESELTKDPEDIWNRRAASWVYYEYIKKEVSPNQFISFKENLNKIRNLKLPDTELLIFDQLAWKVGSLIFKLNKQENIDYKKINELFEIIKEFSFTRPSEAYSFLYKAFHKGYQKWQQYLAFADWWDFQYFHSEDYNKEEFKGKKIISLVEQGYIAYSRKLLEALQDEKSDQEVYKSKIEQFLPMLDQLIDDHPEYQYPPYFKAKLLIAIGDEEKSLSAFIPFAKQKRNEFWVWSLFAEIFSGNEEIQLACLCKGLSLNTPGDFLIKIRQQLAGILISKGMYNEAKTEIFRILTSRKKNDWKLPQEIVDWQKQDWYDKAIIYPDNTELYVKHINTAEQLLFKDIPEEVIVVEFVNENKKILNFVQSESKYGFFKYNRFNLKPLIGDILKVRFSGNNQDEFYKILTLEKGDSKKIPTVLRSFNGRLTINENAGFGFVDDIFFNPDMIRFNKLKNNQQVSGRAIKSYNKKKNTWGWKAFEITSLD